MNTDPTLDNMEEELMTHEELEPIEQKEMILTVDRAISQLISTDAPSKSAVTQELERKIDHRYSAMEEDPQCEDPSPTKTITPATNSITPQNIKTISNTKHKLQDFLYPEHLTQTHQKGT